MVSGVRRQTDGREDSKAIVLVLALLAFLAGTSLSGCSGSSHPPQPQVPPTVTPFSTPPAVALPATGILPQLATAGPASRPPNIEPDTGWQTLQPGLERRHIRLFDPQGRLTESVYLLRLEPGDFRFSVHYSPGQPLSLEEWRRQSEALLVVNGGFFTPANVATGLVVVDGQSFGRSYQGYGGMLAIFSSGLELYDLSHGPYEPSEMLLYGLQSFPILVSDHQPAGALDDTVTARRTAVALDDHDRLLFILGQWGSFTLARLSAFLVASDLEIEVALNLDGGASTGLVLAEPEEGIPAFSLLPTVITVHSR
jgi:hypothetical protein